MADPYLAIASIANDEFMLERMYAAVNQQQHLGNISLGAGTPPGLVAQDWVNNNRYIWASSPGWGDKWASAMASGVEEPGKDESVISDADILSTIQSLAAPPA